MLRRSEALGLLHDCGCLSALQAYPDHALFALFVSLPAFEQTTLPITTVQNVQAVLDVVNR